jgi:hypothetical protein
LDHQGSSMVRLCNDLWGEHLGSHLPGRGQTLLAPEASRLTIPSLPLGPGVTISVFLDTTSSPLPR